MQDDVAGCPTTRLKPGLGRAGTGAGDTIDVAARGTTGCRCGRGGGTRGVPARVVLDTIDIVGERVLHVLTWTQTTDSILPLPGATVVAHLHVLSCVVDRK